jgi:hypothetical protein
VLSPLFGGNTAPLLDTDNIDPVYARLAVGRFLDKGSGRIDGDLHAVAEHLDDMVRSAAVCQSYLIAGLRDNIIEPAALLLEDSGWREPCHSELSDEQDSVLGWIPQQNTILLNGVHLPCVLNAGHHFVQRLLIWQTNLVPAQAGCVRRGRRRANATIRSRQVMVITAREERGGAPMSHEVEAAHRNKRSASAVSRTCRCTGNHRLWLQPGQATLPSDNLT